MTFTDVVPACRLMVSMLPYSPPCVRATDSEGWGAGGTAMREQPRSTWKHFWYYCKYPTKDVQLARAEAWVLLAVSRRCKAGCHRRPVTAAHVAQRRSEERHLRRVSSGRLPGGIGLQPGPHMGGNDLVTYSWLHIRIIWGSLGSQAPPAKTDSIVLG